MMNKLLETVIKASVEAGKEILKIYNTDFKVEYKADESPLTLADKNAHNIIMSFLFQTEIPVLSEEGRSIPYAERKSWEKLWIVDPLDGTKEFIKKNGEFTVNIALIENNKPVMGVVYAPVLDELYFGNITSGAFKISKVSKTDNADILKFSQKLPMVVKKDYYGIVASRSHLSKKTNDYIEALKIKHNNTKIVSVGSSLKLCMIAEGVADNYPRFAPTMEWDTAAGHAIVLASGGSVLQVPDLKNEVVYNKENLLNPWFVASR